MADITKGIGQLVVQENYFEVRNDVNESLAYSGGVKGVSGGTGGNTGVFKTDDIDNGKKSDAHEGNHGFAGDKNDDMTNRNDVNPYFVPQGNTNIPGKRVGTQDNINAIFKMVNFDGSGKANVGKPRHQLYDANSEQSKNVPITK